MFGNNFDKVAEYYNNNAHAQKIAAKRLIEILKGMGESNLQSILELGAGNGILSNLIKNNFDYENIISTDLAYNFLKFNGEPLKVQCNISKLPFKNQSFDNVISSSTLQWIDDLDKLLKEIKHVGKKSFKGAFSIFLKGTFYEMDKVSKLTGFGNILAMKESRYYLENFYKHGFNVDFCHEEKHTIFFDSVREFLNSHKRTGATVKAKKPTTKSNYNSFLKYYKKLFSIKNKIPVSYNIGYYIITKQAGK
ncbi:methyltransferase domain-containing protein [Flexistipes sinusarabici]|nr:methyltransferase domain-containing protein [Flexistipes sinusarabici]